MAFDHRGNTVGNPTTTHGGHRPTPRVSRMLANQLNSMVMLKHQDAVDENPMLGLTNRGPKKVTLDDAQRAINSYRIHRDRGSNVEGEKDDIQWAFRNRKSGDPYDVQNIW